jgi:hypothetical protein
MGIGELASDQMFLMLSFAVSLDDYGTFASLNRSVRHHLQSEDFWKTLSFDISTYLNDIENMKRRFPQLFQARLYFSWICNRYFVSTALYGNLKCFYSGSTLPGRATFSTSSPPCPMYFVGIATGDAWRLPWMKIIGMQSFSEDEPLAQWMGLHWEGERLHCVLHCNSIVGFESRHTLDSYIISHIFCRWDVQWSSGRLEICFSGTRLPACNPLGARETARFVQGYFFFVVAFVPGFRLVPETTSLRKALHQ